MAALLRRELGIEVEMVKGRYGEFKVTVDDRTAVDGGLRVVLGIVPAESQVLDVVRAQLAAGGTGG